MIERLNRTYKASYHHTNWFDNIDDANYDLALWVAYYNFLRPHKHAGYKVLNEVEMLQGADNMPSKWQLLIFLGQQTILNIQKWYCCIGAELLSIEPWNTGTDGFAGCEDRLGQRPKPSESLLELISAIFKVHQSLFL